MKKNIFFLVLLCLPFLATSQDKKAPEVIEHDELMSLGSRPAFIIRFSNTDSKTVENLWKDFVRDQFGKKLKRNKKADEEYALEAKAKSICPEPFDLYSKVEESGNDIVLTLWVDLGVNFLNSKQNERESQELNSYLRAFDVEVEKAKAADRLKEEENQLKDFESELEKLQKKNESFHKDIAEWEEKIRKAQEEIKQNEAEQKEKQKEIDAQKKNVSSAKNYLDGLRR